VLLPPGDPRLTDVDAFDTQGMRMLLLARTSRDPNSMALPQ
jgi:hypothetical protein